MISFNDIEHYEIKSHDLNADLKDVVENPLRAQRSSKKAHEITFDPK